MSKYKKLACPNNYFCIFFHICSKYLINAAKNKRELFKKHVHD